MTAFFDYLHEHPATNELSKVLADIAMQRSTGARRPVPGVHRLAG